MKNSTRTRTAIALATAGVVASAAAGLAAVVDADAGATRATATIRDASGAPVGFARFTEDADGVLHVNVHVDGLEPGLHGIHLHEVGSCSPSFASAGGHHNPLARRHGHHAGDLPNMIVNVAGRGRLQAATTSATLSAGTLSVLDTNGGSIVVHAAQDDFVTDPAGNSGARVACGVIQAA
jgi:Cu-Zn family superoxide dismutase